MTEADSIIRDPVVAVKFARQIFPPEVQQSMVGRQDFDIFREGIHETVKGLYTTYEVSMRLRAAQQEIEKMDEQVRSSEVRAEKAERELSEIRMAKAAELHVAGQSNSIMDERVTQRLLSHAIADRDTASMFAVENARSKGYEQGFHTGRKVGIDKMKEKLVEEVCRCKNRGFKHNWIAALQAAEALQAKGVDSALPRYQRNHFPFSTFEVKKSDDEGEAA